MTATPRRPGAGHAWVRPAPAARTARSTAIDERIRVAAARIADPGLRRLFEGTLANPLDPPEKVDFNIPGEIARATGKNDEVELGEHQGLRADGNGLGQPQALSDRPQIHLAASLRETEHVIYEQQHVLFFLVAEMFRHC